MAHATPHDLYIRFLVTRNLHDLSAMNKSLENNNLKPIKQDQLDAHWEFVERSLPQRMVQNIGDQKKWIGSEFLKWMNVLQVRELWQGQQQFLDPEIRKRLNMIFGLMDDPLLQLTVNALLIKNCPLNDIVEGVNAKFSCMLRDDVLLLYKKFFFEPRRMTRSDWKSFLVNTDSSERNIYFLALTEDLEIVKNALDLPTSMSSSAPLQFLMLSCYNKAREYLSVSSKETNAEARAWISQFSSLVDKYERYKTGDKADFAKQLQMEFEFVETEFPSPGDGVLEQNKLELEEAPQDAK